MARQHPSIFPASNPHFRQSFRALARASMRSRCSEACHKMSSQHLHDISSHDEVMIVYIQNHLATRLQNLEPWTGNRAEFPHKPTWETWKPASARLRYLCSCTTICKRRLRCTICSFFLNRHFFKHLKFRY